MIKAFIEDVAIFIVVLILVVFPVFMLIKAVLQKSEVEIITYRIPEEKVKCDELGGTFDIRREGFNILPFCTVDMTSQGTSTDPIIKFPVVK